MKLENLLLYMQWKFVYYDQYIWLVKNSSRTRLSENQALFLGFQTNTLKTLYDWVGVLESLLIDADLYLASC